MLCIFLDVSRKPCTRMTVELSDWQVVTRNASRQTASLRPFLGCFTGAIFKPGEFFQEGERHFADGAVALLGDDEFRLARFFLFGFLILLVNLGPDEQGDEVGVLL